MTQPQQTTAHMRQLQEEHPWIWLYEIELPTVPPTRFRFTNDTDEVEYGTDSNGDAIVFDPYPVTHSEITQNSGGDIPRFTLRIGNGGSEMIEKLDAHAGLIGQPVVVRVLNRADIMNPASGLRFDARVVSCGFNFEQVQMTLGDYNLTSYRVPSQRYIKDRCRWVTRYKGPECAATSPLPTCGGTKADCAARDNTLRYGGWPSLGKQGRR